MSIAVVFVEVTEGSAKRASLEALGAARAAGAQVVAVHCGSDAETAAAAAGSNGASKAYVLPNEPHSPDALAEALVGIVRDEKATAFLAAATSTGRDLAPRVAASVDSPLLSDCTGLESDDSGFLVTRPWLAGKLIAQVRSTAPVLCATLRRNQFAPVTEEGTADVLTAAAPAAGKAVMTGMEAKQGGKLDVSEAPIVVSGGRGLKEPENFAIVEKLADAFGNAAVGASRAVVDAGWRPHSEQVGQTGKTVSPQLYVAIGISGAIQHLAGMKTSKIIVAINKDPEAPIFKIADYGIVGDAFEIVPALTEEIQKLRAKD